MDRYRGEYPGQPLRDIRTERERRQTIGRGLRLCVNQAGERLRGFDLNTLTVVATESYEEFAENLQQEIEADTGIRFGVVAAHQFAAIPVTGKDGRVMALGVESSKVLWEHLKAEGYIDAMGRIQDSLRKALKDGTFSLPDEFIEQRMDVAELLRKLVGRLEIKNANERRPVRPRQAVLHGREFKALWDRIKHKTTYRVAFDNEDLLAYAQELFESEELTGYLKNMPMHCGWRSHRLGTRWRVASMGYSRVLAIADLGCCSDPGESAGFARLPRSRGTAVPSLRSGQALAMTAGEGVLAVDLVPFLDQVFIPFGDFDDEVGGAVGNGLAGQAGLQRNRGGFVQLVQFVVRGLAARIQSLFHDNVTG